MRRVSVAELKNQLSHWIRLVKRGETVEIVEHRMPIARITQLRDAPAATDETLRCLIRNGIVKAASRSGGAETISRAPVPCSGDVVAALVNARAER